MSDTLPVVVVGAGAAGMMAAGRASEIGAPVLLLEKMERPGKKILISGKGRCNLSNTLDVDGFIARFGTNGRFLHGPFSRFFRDDLLILLDRLGVPCRAEPGGRLFPVSNNARDVVRAFQKYMTEGGVTIRLGEPVVRLLARGGRVCGVETPSGEIAASAVVLAAGGSSHPQTGSTGDGTVMAAAMGHTIVRLRPGLVPLVVFDRNLCQQMMGASLKDARVTAFALPSRDVDAGKTPRQDVVRGHGARRPRPPVIESRRGDAIITHFGLSGPVVLEISLAVVDNLEAGPVSVSIDMVPDLEPGTLRADLQSSMERHARRTCRNLLTGYVPPKVAGPLAELARIDPEAEAGRLTAADRDRLADLLKSLRFDIERPYSMSTAMVTAGGVSLDEVDSRSMESRVVKGLYLCGEVLDLDAGTGGFNLQAAFSTGYVAGESAASAALRGF